ncbi:hypothetical protein [Falsiroseomonas sp. HW251]|uniref:hypothetical protein n=1 Tax=Falsiroseomonas sp. HW251 TaxID=3390998 RepID=UPI003D31B518
MPRERLHPGHPGPSNPNRATRLCRMLLPRVVAFMLTAPGVPAAAPALEYGPEAEASFLLRCAGPDQAGDAATACRRVMERLQETLGYEAFLERAADGPDGFAMPPGPGLVTDLIPPRVAVLAR